MASGSSSLFSPRQRHHDITADDRDYQCRSNFIK